MLIMHQLAGVLLNVDAFDPEGLGAAFGVLLVQDHLDRALAHDRVIELADLIALRQIGIEVVLAIKPRPLVDLRLDRKARAHRLADALPVRHRQHARHGRIDQADLAVRLCAKGRGSTGKELRLSHDLGVDFQPDHHFPFARGALNAIAAHLTTTFPAWPRTARALRLRGRRLEHPVRQTACQRSGDPAADLRG